MITIVAVGTKMPSWVEDGITHYTKQLKSITIHTLKNSTKEKEAKECLAYIHKHSPYVIILDERGNNLNSMEFAAEYTVWQQHKHCVFIIGGAFGISDEVKAQAHQTLSLSRATLPHTLARLVLIEQLYRATQINLGHPYHKE